MSQKRRQRTAEYHQTVLDRIALGMADRITVTAIRKREAIEDRNFRNLVARGVIVEERTETCQNKPQLT